MSRFTLLGGGVRLRVGVRGKKKDQKETKGTTKPLMTINKKCTAATAAGHITAIKALQSKIEAICAKYKTKGPIPTPQAK